MLDVVGKLSQIITLRFISENRVSASTKNGITPPNKIIDEWLTGWLNMVM